MDKDRFIEAFRAGRTLKNDAANLKISDHYLSMYAELNMFADEVRDSGLEDIVEIGSFGHYYMSISTANWYEGVME